MGSLIPIILAFFGNIYPLLVFFCLFYKSQAHNTFMFSMLSKLIVLRDKRNHNSTVRNIPEYKI